MPSKNNSECDGGGTSLDNETNNRPSNLDLQTPETPEETSSITSCFHIINEFIDPTSPHESEFDEFLAMPDTVTVCSISGEAVLVDNSTMPTENGDTTDNAGNI